MTDKSIDSYGKNEKGQPKSRPELCHFGCHGSTVRAVKLKILPIPASNSQYENWGKSGFMPRGESCYAVNQDV